MLAGNAPDVARARSLRRAMSLPEVLLWRALKTRPEGLKFRRQHAAAGYVADFYCHDARLVTEIDGAAHDCGDRPARDAARDAFFGARGIATLRRPAAYVLADVGAAVETIVVTARATPLRRFAPPPLAGEDCHGGTNALSLAGQD
jgi:very-short-patch-repair endonuclease